MAMAWEKLFQKPETRGILIGLLISFGSIVCGNITGYPSPAVPDINGDTSNLFSLTPQQQSWYVSVSYLSGMVGASISGSVMDTFGRKLGLLLCALVLSFGWLITISSINLIMLFAGKVIMGFTLRAAISIIVVYNTEIALPAIRGTLVSFHEVSLNFGICLSYIMGSFLTWNWLATACLGIVTVWSFLILFVPESPRWLLARNQPEEAEVALRYLRGKYANIESEIQEIKKGLVNQVSKTDWIEYTRQPYRRPLLISVALFVFNMFSGMPVVHGFTVSIFQSSGVHLNPFYETITSGGFMFLGACIGTTVMDRFERRTLLIVSGCSMTLGMLTLGTFYKVIEMNLVHTAQRLKWLPVTALAIYSLGFQVGFGSIPYVMVGELFPTKARGRAASISILVAAACGFTVTKSFEDLQGVLQQSGTFWLYCGWCVAGTLFSIFFVPRTRGKSLECIQSESLHTNPVYDAAA